jgi:cysteine synthase
VNPDQYFNANNYEAHSRWTGPQIFAQLPGIKVTFGIRRRFRKIIRIFQVLAASMGTAGEDRGTKCQVCKLTSLKGTLTGTGLYLKKVTSVVSIGYACPPT